MIIIREDYFDDVEMQHISIEGRLAIAEIKKNGKEMRIASIYASTKVEERSKHLESIKKHLKRVTSITIAGDFNCVNEVKLEVENENPLAYPNKGAEILDDLIEELQLIDERRTQSGEEKEFTRIVVNPNKVIIIRLDRFYVPLNLELLSTCMKCTTNKS